LVLIRQHQRHDRKRHKDSLRTYVDNLRRGTLASIFHAAEVSA
jgi:hypothetical protein